MKSNLNRCGGEFYLRSQWLVLTLVVELLQSREAAQHRQAVPVGICSTTGVFSQTQHSETCQGTQMAQLREGGNHVLPQIELTQRQTPSHWRKGWDAVGTGGKTRAQFDIISVITFKKLCVYMFGVRETFTNTNLSASTSILTIWEKIEI